MFRTLLWWAERCHGETNAGMVRRTLTWWDERCCGEPNWNVQNCAEWRCAADQPRRVSVWKLLCGTENVDQQQTRVTVVCVIAKKLKLRNKKIKRQAKKKKTVAKATQRIHVCLTSLDGCLEYYTCWGKNLVQEKFCNELRERKRLSCLPILKANLRVMLRILSYLSLHSAEIMFTSLTSV